MSAGSGKCCLLFLGMIFNLLLLFAGCGSTVLSDSVVMPECDSNAELFGPSALPVATALSTLDQELAAYEGIHADGHAGATQAQHILCTPLIWWKEHQHQYPLFASAARHFFTLLATSVASERAFSTAGWVVSQRRCSMSPATTSTLMLVHANSDFGSFAPPSPSSSTSQ